MAPPRQRAQPGTNRLLALLPPDEHRRLFDSLEEINLASRQVIARPGEHFSHVIFPAAGVISILVPMGEQTSVEAAVVGFEGMVGLPLALGPTTSQHEVICQVSDGGWQISADRFRELLRTSPGLLEILQRYALALVNQTARSSACDRTHDINQRLARWLLLVHDRVIGDELRLTQESLSEMLGVRRPSVSLAATALQHAGLIAYRWGRITILNRRGLEDAVCEDYQQTIDEYEAVFSSTS